MWEFSNPQISVLWINIYLERQNHASPVNFSQNAVYSQQTDLKTTNSQYKSFLTSSDIDFKEFAALFDALDPPFAPNEVTV